MTIQGTEDLPGGLPGLTRHRYLMGWRAAATPHARSEREMEAAQRAAAMAEIVSPEFAEKLALARELGLLEPVLAGQTEEASARASQLLDALFVEIYPQHPLVPSQPASHRELVPAE